MFTPSPEIIHLLSTFAVGMTAPTFAKALVLIYGAILTPGRRTITAMLRVQGLDGAHNFGKYHRVLNQAPWSALVMSQLLLGLLIVAFVPDGQPLLVLIDETLERRQGKKIGYNRQSAPPYVSLSNFGMSIHSPLQRRRLCDTRTVLTSRRSRNHTAR